MCMKRVHRERDVFLDIHFFCFFPLCMTIHNERFVLRLLFARCDIIRTYVVLCVLQYRSKCHQIFHRLRSADGWIAVPQIRRQRDSLRGSFWYFGQNVWWIFVDQIKSLEWFRAETENQAPHRNEQWSSRIIFENTSTNLSTDFNKFLFFSPVFFSNCVCSRNRSSMWGPKFDSVTAWTR